MQSLHSQSILALLTLAANYSHFVMVDVNLATRALHQEKLKTSSTSSIDLVQEDLIGVLSKVRGQGSVLETVSNTDTSYRIATMYA